MKTNNNQNEGGYLCGVSGDSGSSGDWRQAYADFFVNYVQDYSRKESSAEHLRHIQYLPRYLANDSDTFGPR